MIDQRIVRHAGKSTEFRTWLEDADQRYRSVMPSAPFGLFDVFDESTRALRDAFEMGIGPRDFADDTTEWAKRERARRVLRGSGCNFKRTMRERHGG